MRFATIVVTAFLLFGLGACKRSDADRKDSNAEAYKAGQAAHKLANETEEAARKAGRKLDEAAKSAKRGWENAPPQSKDTDKR